VELEVLVLVDSGGGGGGRRRGAGSGGGSDAHDGSDQWGVAEDVQPLPMRRAAAAAAALPSREHMQARVMSALAPRSPTAEARGVPDVDVGSVAELKSMIASLQAQVGVLSAQVAALGTAPPPAQSHRLVSASSNVREALRKLSS
jgi:hypothetical protein